MTYIQTGAAIGFAVAAGVGTFILGMTAVVILFAMLMTLVAIVGGAEDEKEHPDDDV